MITLPKSKNKAGNFQGSVIPHIEKGKFYYTKNENNKRTLAWSMKKEK